MVLPMSLNAVDSGRRLTPIEPHPDLAACGSGYYCISEGAFDWVVRQQPCIRSSRADGYSRLLLAQLLKFGGEYPLRAANRVYCLGGPGSLMLIEACALLQTAKYEPCDAVEARHKLGSALHIWLDGFLEFSVPESAIDRMRKSTSRLLPEAPFEWLVLSIRTSRHLDLLKK